MHFSFGFGARDSHLSLNCLGADILRVVPTEQVLQVDVVDAPLVVRGSILLCSPYTPDVLQTLYLIPSSLQ